MGSIGLFVSTDLDISFDDAYETKFTKRDMVSHIMTRLFHIRSTYPFSNETWFVQRKLSHEYPLGTIGAHRFDTFPIFDL